jgi:hypothetical protein
MASLERRDEDDIGPGSTSFNDGEYRPNLNNTIFARIAVKDSFGHCTLVVIVLNALWIGWEVDNNHANLERNSSEPIPVLAKTMENLFCTFFSIELAIRFLAYTRKCDFFKEAWNIFDGVLVLFMVIETWLLEVIAAIADTSSTDMLAKFSTLRLLRLLRLTRMARIMKEIPELLTLVKGMISATRAVSMILIILVLCMYVFAIVFTSYLGDYKAPEHTYKLDCVMETDDAGELVKSCTSGRYWEDPEEPQPTGVQLFGSIGESMMSLFTRGMLCDNLAETLVAIKDYGDELLDCQDPDKPDRHSAYCQEGLADDPNFNTPEYCKDWRLYPDNVTDVLAVNCNRERISYGSAKALLLMWFFILFVMISACCLLNMLIGVLCEVITASAEEENESTQIAELRRRMEQAFAAIDSSQDGLITSHEWESMKKEPAVRHSLANLGVEEEHMDERLDQMQESLFEDEDPDGQEEEPGIVRFSQYDGKPKRCSTGRPINGLSFSEFMEKVVEIRPDTPASALDIEILRVRIEREERNIDARLNFIETALTNVTAASREAPSPPRMSSPPQNVSSDWLRDVPSEVLFAVLQSRAPPELGLPKALIEAKS